MIEVPIYPLSQSPTEISFRNIPESAGHFKASNAKDKGGHAMLGIKITIKTASIMTYCVMFLDQTSPQAAAQETNKRLSGHSSIGG